MQFKISPHTDFNWFWLCTCPKTSFHCNTRTRGFHDALMQLRTEFFQSSSGRETHSSLQLLNIQCEIGLGNFRLGSAAWIPAWQYLGCSSDISKNLDFLNHLRNPCVCFLLSRVLFLVAAAALCLLYFVSTYTKLLWMLFFSNYAWLLLHTLPLLPRGIHWSKIYRGLLHYCGLLKMVLKKTHKLFVILKRMDRIIFHIKFINPLSQWQFY